MDSTKFDHLSRMMAQIASRRTAVQVVAALLAALGLGSFGFDEAEAKKSCSKKCRKKKTKKRRQRCRKRCRKRRRRNRGECKNNADCGECETCSRRSCVSTCTADETCENDQCVCMNPCGAACCGADETCVGSGENQTCCPTSDKCGGPEPEVMICCTGDERCVGQIPNQECRVVEVVDQDGSGTLTLQSAAGCQFTEEGCVQQVAGTISGSPIGSGTFSGTLTGTNYQPGTEPNTFTADFAGAITVTDDGTGDTLTFTVQDHITGDESGDPPATFTSAGQFMITGGTGQFAGASGSGMTSGSGTDSGATGTLDSFTMDGEIVYA